MRQFATDLGERMRIFTNQVEENQKELSKYDPKVDVILFVSKIEVF
jgi:hypothetical protein